MKNFKIRPTLITLSALGVALFLLSWGVIGHERINRAAVMALPKPLQTFFYNHIDFITQESTVPDLRRNVLNDKMEPPRHYFDMENFGDEATFPKTMDEAKLKYDEKFLTKNGILPWHIQDLMVKLTKAFKEKRKNEILFIAGDLGHYIADGHMPLHTSDNHDGQNTNQKGIHSLWESRLPELFAKDYKFNVPQGVYLENVEKATWDMIFDTHSLVEPLLAIDKKLRTATPENKIFVTDASGVIVKNKYGGTMYSDEYAKQLHADMNGMVQQQMRKAITVTASFWYTAWVNAGKPDLSGLDAAELTKRNNKTLKKDLKTFEKGNLFGLSNEKE
ncbi:zinc dependent phospholipase C family protein [Flavobacterium sinopsychrotolerans]|uniref:Zinc dependent phospholipase C n=1 Tax=Flavobacterium sinopsychrotolerans TaxID=604089 RepID=A0A1H8M610_9FLAO|nr:zinc dependent phospholipase C family protein [Flavobacterium sinopsychrotolerans]SEO12775.1 Zinc dependent phospholipase C [Flavobacterium sinopsychrotolerans]